MTTVPPAFAARLLKRLVPKQDHDALLGDLCEEYQRGRSLLWYLVQILAAILVGSWKDANTRRGIALGAIMAGFVLQIVFGASLLAIRVTGREYSPWAPELWSILESYELLRIAGDIAVGWLLVSLYRSYGMTMLLAFRAAMLGVVLIIFLWYAGLFAMRAETALLLSLAAQFRVALASFVFESIVMLAGGYLATRRLESV
jgi:hypothetical protein